MKNLVMQSGRNITVPAPYDVESGDGVLIGALFGVASNKAATGQPVVIDTGGVYALKKTAGQTFSSSCPKAYWDNTARSVTASSSGTTLIGVGIKAAAGGDPTVTTRLGIVA